MPKTCQAQLVFLGIKQVNMPGLSVISLTLYGDYASITINFLFKYWRISCNHKIQVVLNHIAIQEAFA